MTAALRIGIAFVIDVNPNCDLGPDGGFARSAAQAGIGYRDLALRLARARASELCDVREGGRTSDGSRL